MSYLLFFFFFQAEDGIRDLTVTGVQTCALPIFANGVTVARAKINPSILVTLEHVPESCSVRLGQVHYMRIIANCRVVWSGVIRPVYLEGRFLSQRTEWRVE